VRLSATGLFPLALMLALAMVTFWLKQAVEEPAPQSTLRRHDPDYIVENFNITSYGPRGAAESTLQAAKMIHYPDDDSTDLVAPRMVQTKPDEPRMTVTADRGTLSQGADELFLYGNVLLVRAGDAERPEMQMRTSFLHIVSAKSLALTDRQVTISDSEQSITGRGMEYNNELGRLILRERVRGRFEPEKNKP
jgi:lipopolysaccharide export system protein LptC